MLTLLLGFSALTCLIFAAYPYALYPLLLSRLPTRPIATGACDTTGAEYALLFCTYNEQRNISKKLENIGRLLLQYPDLEVLVYDDQSDDQTPEILRNSDLPLRLVHGDGRRGKAHGMKELRSRTDRPYLIFTDANVFVDDDAIGKIHANYADPSIGGICGTLEYVSPQLGTTGVATGAYWKLEELTKSLESRSGNVMGADGAIFSVRAHLYPDFPDTVLDDLTVSMAVVFSGFRLIKDDAVVGREEIVTDGSKDLARRVRISTRAFHTHMWLRPNLATLSRSDRWRYRSHRTVRWFGGVALVLAILLLIAAMLDASPIVGASTAGCLGLVIVAAYRFDVRLISSLVHIGLSMVLTSYGVTQALAGRTRVTWNPPR